MDIHSYRKKDPLFQKLLNHLPEKEISKIHLKLYHRKEHLISCTNYSDAVFLILNGMCVITKISCISQKPIIMSRVGYLDIIGLHEIINNIDRVGNVIARTDCMAAIISRSDLEYWMAAYPRFVLFLCERVSTQYFQQIDYMNYYIRYSVECAVLSFLIYQYELIAQSPLYTSHIIRIVDTRQEIGDEIGHDARSINKVILKYKQLGLLTIHKGKLCLTADQIKELVLIRDRLDG